MLKFLHAADIHLDSPLRGLDAYEGAPVEQIRGATRRAFENLVDSAIDEAVDFVAASPGDLYDGDWKDYNTGLFFVRADGRLREAGIPVFSSPATTTRRARSPAACACPTTCTSSRTRAPRRSCSSELERGAPRPELRDAAPYATIWPSLSPSRCRAASTSACCTPALTGREGHEPYAPCTLERSARKGYDYWALGHVHQREVFMRGPAGSSSPATSRAGMRARPAEGLHARHAWRMPGARPIEFRPSMSALGARPRRRAAGCNSATMCSTASRPASALLVRRRRGAHGRAGPGRGRHRRAPDACVRSGTMGNGDPARSHRSGAGACGWKRSGGDPTRTLGDRPITDGPLGDLLSLIDEWRRLPDRPRRLAAELAELEKKLPPRIHGRARRLGPDPPRAACGDSWTSPSPCSCAD